MSSLKKCSRCKGTKIIMAMGGLEKKCHVCKGIGFVDKVDEKDEDNFLRKKRVRKIKSVSSGQTDEVRSVVP